MDLFSYYENTVKIAKIVELNLTNYMFTVFLNKL